MLPILHVLLLSLLRKLKFPTVNGRRRLRDVALSLSTMVIVIRAAMRTAWGHAIDAHHVLRELEVILSILSLLTLVLLVLFIRIRHKILIL